MVYRLAFLLTRLELAAAAEERERYLKRSEHRQRAEKTADNLRRTVERMDQTDDAQALVRSLADIYHDHGLHEQIYEYRRLHEQEAEGLPRIICSEAFV